MELQVPNAPDLYRQIMTMPENITGEIINGRLITQPRPAGPHGFAESILGMEIGSSYQRGRNGPGGWLIIIEPEIHFIRDTEVVVPDIAGWKKERMQYPPRTHRYEVIPDWICEITSPSTAKIDRNRKMPLYANYGVNYMWLVDPLLKTLDVYELLNGCWLNIKTFRDYDIVSAVPFQELAIHLVDLWIPDD